jgi:hypothetical protein
MGRSGVEGRVVTIPKGDSVQVSVMVQGRPGTGDYPADIRRGSCQGGGAVLNTLNPVHSESDGMGRSLSTVPAERMSGGDGRFVQVRGPDGTIACGDVQAISPISP